MPDLRFDAPVPDAAPRRAAVTPQLVAYPGIEVSWVANADGETYHYRGIYYTFFDGNWFRARNLRGPWSFIEMKYVPSDLFRVRGHRPPTLAAAG
jgi:hypothetical protein